MLFNSVSFMIFLPIVFILYWFAANKNLKFQNLLLLGSSYFFYACWDWRFLFLLIFSTLLDFYTGIKISESDKRNSKRFWFWLSIGTNLGFLGVFKYYNFFALSFTLALARVGLTVDPWLLNIVLPVGISFYTFHGLSYVIDIFKARIKAERNIVDYSLFVSFFPLLVAGPIERATHLLPQIKADRSFNYSQMTDGLRQILWGLFKKIVIADSCAEYANLIFNNYSSYSGSTLLLGVIFFSFQIYCDFSGYSDIALGTARLFGIELLRNFSFPYFSRNIAEFWRRWHISLSTWFRDYLYIPLGGSKGSVWMKIRNVFIIFLVSGFWHGANWTFIIWGALHALYIIPSILLGENRKFMNIVAHGKQVPSLTEVASIIATFTMVSFAWIFFRAETLSHALHYISGVFSLSVFAMPSLLPIRLFVLLTAFVLIEWKGRERNYALENLEKIKSPILRWSMYYGIIICILTMGNFKENQFIYFQF